MLNDKIKAFTIHLGVSVVLVSLIVSGIIYFWYPLQYLGATSFKNIALLIISIDLVVGPILTFVVFNKRKKSLRFDLAVIAILQLSALAYGSYVLYQGHPVYITFAQGSFNLVNAQLAKPDQAKFEEYKISKLSSANLAYAEIPKDDKAQEQLLDDSMTGGADLQERADLYKPYEDNVASIMSSRYKLDSSEMFSQENDNDEIRSFEEEYGEKIDDFAYFALEGSTKDIIIVLDGKSAKPVDTIDVDPWQYVKKDTQTVVK